MSDTKKIRCKKCGHEWDESLSGQGEFACPSCGAEIPGDPEKSDGSFWINQEKKISQ